MSQDFGDVANSLAALSRRINETKQDSLIRANLINIVTVPDIESIVAGTKCYAGNTGVDQHIYGEIIIPSDGEDWTVFVGGKAASSIARTCLWSFGIEDGSNNYVTDKPMTLLWDTTFVYSINSNLGVQYANTKYNIDIRIPIDGAVNYWIYDIGMILSIFKDQL
jgi:hypothetical protein